MISNSQFNSISFLSILALLLMPGGELLAEIETADYALNASFTAFYLTPPDSSGKDTSSKLPYPIKDRKPYERTSPKNPFDLGEPSNVKVVMIRPRNKLLQLQLENWQSRIPHASFHYVERTNGSRK